MQDQTVKIAEAEAFESELQRLREENADLRKRTGEVASVEAAKKKADMKIEQLEEKVSVFVQYILLPFSMMAV